MGVNFWGVVHGHRAFIPRMIEQGEGHVVNTASMAGHLPGHSPYTASKWAVVGITQGLYNTMATDQTGIGVSSVPGVGPHRDRRGESQPTRVRSTACALRTDRGAAGRSSVREGRHRRRHGADAVATSCTMRS